MSGYKRNLWKKKVESGEAQEYMDNMKRMGAIRAVVQDARKLVNSVNEILPELHPNKPPRMIMENGKTKCMGCNMEVAYPWTTQCGCPEWWR